MAPARAVRGGEGGRFTAVEFWWPFPEAVPADHDLDAFVRTARDVGAAIGLNFFAGDMTAGDRRARVPARSLRPLPRQPRRHGRHRRAAGVLRLQRALRQPGGGLDPRGAGCRGHRAFALADRAAARSDGVVLLEPLNWSAGLPAAHCHRGARCDRPSRTGHRRDEPRDSLRPLPPGGQSRRPRRHDRRYSAKLEAGGYGAWVA